MKRVTEACHDAIVSGRLKPGEQIRERELVEKLVIRRSPLREAIRILESDGLITSIPHRDSCVSELTAADLRETNEERIMFETFAARLARDRLDEPTSSTDALPTRARRDRARAGRGCAPGTSITAPRARRHS